ARAGVQRRGDPHARGQGLRRPADDRQPARRGRGELPQDLQARVRPRQAPHEWSPSMTIDVARSVKKMFIAGAWVESESGEHFDAESPATGEVIAEVPKGTRADAQRAVEAAHRARAAMAGLKGFERSRRLHRIAEAIEKRRDEIARLLTLDQGKPLKAEALGEVDECIEYFRIAAEDLKRLEGRVLPSASPSKLVLARHYPRGVYGIITPWNWPLTMAAELIAPALAAGNTVVWTPGERILVEEPVRDEFVARLADAARALRLGDPFADDTTLGPLNNEGVATKMDQHVADALKRGAKLVLGGERAKGFPTRLYYHATILDGVEPDMRVSREETFGPIAPIIKFRDEKQALELANDSPYGLLGAVYTKDLSRALRFADA